MVHLFSDDALALLDSMVYDPNAKASYELWSGGLFWPDEFPERGTCDADVVWQGFLPRFLIGYRASLTLDEPRRELQVPWEQVSREAPNWPGLLEERRGKKALHRLLAAKRREAICLEESKDWKW